jgi:hypothetical protein
MPASDCGLGHVIGHRMIAISRQAINTGPHQEVGADLLCRAEEFVDVALSVADMNAARRIAQRFSGLPKVLQPTDAFLLFDRNPRQVDLSLESCRSLELLPVPEFDGGQAEGERLGCHREA